MKEKKFFFQEQNQEFQLSRMYGDNDLIFCNERQFNRLMACLLFNKTVFQACLDLSTILINALAFKSLVNKRNENKVFNLSCLFRTKTFFAMEELVIFDKKRREISLVAETKLESFHLVLMPRQEYKKFIDEAIVTNCSTEASLKIANLLHKRLADALLKNDMSEEVEKLRVNLDFSLEEKEFLTLRVLHLEIDSRIQNLLVDSGAHYVWEICLLDKSVFLAQGFGPKTMAALGKELISNLGVNYQDRLETLKEFLVVLLRQRCELVPEISNMPEWLCYCREINPDEYLDRIRRYKWHLSVPNADIHQALAKRIFRLVNSEIKK